MPPNSDKNRSIEIVLTQMVTWLDLLDADQAIQGTQGWEAGMWQLAAQVAFMQGIGPFLYARLSSSRTFDSLPRVFGEYLQREHALNLQRVNRIHGELQAILHAANRRGLPVMPLKGSLLTTLGYVKADLRPMADIDLLVRPADREPIGTILGGFGYRLQSSANHYARHDRYLRPEDERVVSFGNEHPDNPRPVEVHLTLSRRLWGDAGGFDLSAFMWSESRPVSVLGETSWAPRPEHLLVHLAAHATENLLLQNGRLTQFLDLAAVASQVDSVDDLPYPEFVYPSLQLARRILPGQTENLRLEALACRAAPQLQKWCQTVPLTSQCGLTTALTPDTYSQWRKRWHRWRPSTWRLKIGYGDIPLSLAYVNYVVSLGQRLLRH